MDNHQSRPKLTLLESVELSRRVLEELLHVTYNEAAIEGESKEDMQERMKLLKSEIEAQEIQKILSERQLNIC